MCSKISALLLLAWLSLSPLSAQESQPDFSTKLSAALALVLETLSPEQARLLIPVLELYDSQLTTLDAELSQLSTNLEQERKARDAKSLSEAIFWGGGGVLTGAVLTLAIVVLLHH